MSNIPSVQFSATYNYQLSGNFKDEVDAQVAPHLDELGRGKYSPESEDLLIMEAEKPLYVEYDEDTAELKLQLDTPPTERGRDKETIIEFLKSANLSKSFLKQILKTFPADQTNDVSMITLSSSFDIGVEKQSVSPQINPVQNEPTLLVAQEQFFEAIKSGDTAKMDAVLKANPSMDINFRDEDGKTALDLAVINDRAPALAYLWNQESTYKTDGYIQELLHQAVQNDSQLALTFLLDQPEIDPNATNQNGSTALYLAASRNMNTSLGCAKLLLNHPDIDPNKGHIDIQRKDSKSPLFYVDSEILDALLAHPDINPNIGHISLNDDTVGLRSPLYWAAYFNDIEKVEKLLSHPDTVSFYPSGKGKTPLGADDRISMKRSVKKALKEAGCRFRKYKDKHTAEKMKKWIDTNFNLKYASKRIDEVSRPTEILLYAPSMTSSDIREVGEKYYGSFEGDTRTNSEKLYAARKENDFTRAFKPRLEKALSVKIAQENAIQQLRDAVNAAD